MRTTLQPWNAIVARMEIIGGGLPMSGLAPTVAIQRVSDGLFYNGTTWAVPLVALVMTEHSTISGLYEYAIDPTDLDMDDGVEGYLCRYREATLPLAEMEAIQQTVPAWAEQVASFGGAGSFGNEFFRMLALRQQNVRIVYDAWTSDGKPIHGIVYIYASKAALEADVDPWPGAVGSYEIDATYDGSLRLTEYTSTRES